jgi:hypothetical protein
MAAVAALLWLFGAAGLALTYLLSFLFSVRVHASSALQPHCCHMHARKLLNALHRVAACLWCQRPYTAVATAGRPDMREQGMLEGR